MMQREGLQVFQRERGTEYQRLIIDIKSQQANHQDFHEYQHCSFVIRLA